MARSTTKTPPPSGAPAAARAHHHRLRRRHVAADLELQRPAVRSLDQQPRARRVEAHLRRLDVVELTLAGEAGEGAQQLAHRVAVGTCAGALGGRGEAPFAARRRVAVAVAALQADLAAAVGLDGHRGGGRGVETGQQQPRLLGALLAPRQRALPEPQHRTDHQDDEEEAEQRARFHGITSGAGRRRRRRARWPGRAGRGAPARASSDTGTG